MNRKNTVIAAFIILFAFLPGFIFKKKDLPPGTVYFKNNLYIDKSVISNINYYEYLYQTNQMNDTIISKKIESDLYKYLYEKENFLPTISISYEEAKKYCAWRTRAVNTMYYIKKNKLKYNDYKTIIDTANIPKVVEYRLPTLKEFKELEAMSITSPQNKNIICSVKNGKPNSIGVYGWNSNVSEMTATKGIAYGQNYLQQNKNDTSKIIEYTQPTTWLGFRCICEVKKDFKDFYKEKSR